MAIYSDLQSLEPGQIVELYELDLQSIVGETLYFHGYTQIGKITWQGIEYAPWPIQVQGIQYTTDQPPTPTFTAGNIDGSLTALCLQYQDLVGGKLIRHRTLGKYLDAVNFSGGNAHADPDQEIPNDTWYLERKSTETSTSITWELSSAINLNGVQLPGRQIVANSCIWLSRGGYKGPYCGYTGTAYFDINDQPVTDPAKDVCAGRLSSCKARFGAKNPLPYGGFPAAGLISS